MSEINFPTLYPQAHIHHVSFQIMNTNIFLLLLFHVLAHHPIASLTFQNDMYYFLSFFLSYLFMLFHFNFVLISMRSEIFAFHFFFSCARIKPWTLTKPHINITMRLLCILLFQSLPFFSSTTRFSLFVFFSYYCCLLTSCYFFHGCISSLRVFRSSVEKFDSIHLSGICCVSAT